MVNGSRFDQRPIVSIRRSSRARRRNPRGERLRISSMHQLSSDNSLPNDRGDNIRMPNGQNPLENRGAMPVKIECGRGVPASHRLLIGRR